MDSRRPSRYGCLECSEDAEAVLGERLPAAAEERYFDHIRGCPRCWRAHRVLQQLYAGPEVPSERSSTSLNREFAGILRGLAEAREERTLANRANHLGASAAVVALATTACVLALMLIPGQGGDLFDRTPWVIAFDDPDTIYGGIDHPAMVYGRIVGGHGRVLDSRGETLADHIFPTATRLETDAAESMQLQLVGKILTNIGPSSELTWRSAGSGEVELGLERGLVAFRYDRLPGDPTLKIETPTATVQIRGTVFTVEVDDAGHTTVSVLRGKVEVQGPDKRVLADVRAGYRFDVAARSFSDVGRAEVQVALPLSLGPGSGVEELSGGRIPSSWTVPGLPANPQYRTLDNLIEITDKPRRQGARVARVDRSAKSVLAPNDDGQALLEMLVRDAENTRAEAIRSSLSRCKELYLSPDSRYRSSQCLRTFIDEHDGDTRAAEAHLLIGIQRMDYAGDHQAAMDEFRKFIERAPDHPEAELARYRLWLAATEKGDIQEAKRLGRAYLHSHPRGRYVGQIIKRFRDLASELGG